MQMLSEDCSIFLEIADVIRSLGLTILKGVTETYDEKTLISFVVEVQTYFCMIILSSHLESKNILELIQSLSLYLNLSDVLIICRGRTTEACLGWIYYGHSCRCCSPR